VAYCELIPSSLCCPVNVRSRAQGDAPFQLQGCVR
jgi:hypothetical protein